MSELLNDMISTAEECVERFAGRFALDFSMESLQEVENLLEEVSDILVDEEEVVDTISYQVGSYIFETLRRLYGGTYYWIREEEQPILVCGGSDYEVSFKAWEKVKGRIINGEEDNIPFYVDGIIMAIERGKVNKGYQAMII